jgi:hypothetical protein
VKHTTGFYPRVRVDGAGKGVVSQAGGSLLTEAVRVSGLDRLLAAGLAPWRKLETNRFRRHWNYPAYSNSLSNS